MTADEKQKICDNIFQYITKKLDDWMDNQIFTKTSMKELGELYYNHVLNEVENADTHLLNAVIRTIKPRNVECITQEDYYVALCKILYFKKLQVEQYVTDLHDYWKDNRTVFKLDSVSFLYIWGSMLTWTMITALCLIIGALSYSKLPTEIPVQWSKGVATSLVNKNWIFICPVICIIIRYLLKPFIYAKLQMNNYYGEIITEYLTNYMCFIVLSVEIFSILFTFGVVKSVVVLLFVDTAIFIGLLVVGLVKMDLRGKEVL